MNINNRDKNIEVSFLQSYLADKIDLDVAVSGTYDLATHKKLIQYLQYPEIQEAARVRDELSYCSVRINATTQKLFTYVFTIQTNSQNITCTQKSTSYLKADNGEDVQASYLSDSLLDTIKPIVYNLGWDLTFEVNDKSKFIVYLAPSFNKSTLPRKTLLPMVNLAGLDYLDGWEISQNTFAQSTDDSLTAYALDLNVAGATGSNVDYFDLSSANVIELLGVLYELAEEERKTKIEITVGDIFQIWYTNASVWSWTVAQGDERTNPALSSAMNKIVKQGGSGPITKNVAIRILRGTKRLYIINNIDQTKSYAIMHSLDGVLKAKVAFCEDLVSSRRIRETEHFMLRDVIVPTYELINNVTVKGIPQNNVFFVPSSMMNNIKSIIVEITKPQFENYQIEYACHDLYGDMNGNGYYDEEDLIIANEYKTLFPDGQQSPNVEISNRAHFCRMLLNEPKKMLGDKNELSYANVEDTVLYLENIIVGKMDKYCYAFDRLAKTNMKEEYIFVGQVDDDLIKKYYQEKQFGKELYQAYYDANFHDEPFLVHSQLMDYLLDTSIHKYSEEERIFMIQQLVGLPDSYNGYTEHLRDVIRNIQKDNSIPFQTGYADSSTLFILREGE